MEISDPTDHTLIRNDYINNRIKDLRKNLLDISRKNPLISTKFSKRSNSLISIIDEIPELLLGSIMQQKMQIVSLPDLRCDPKDEDNIEFKKALAEAKLNDEQYLGIQKKAQKNIGEASDLLTAEREIKDRLRSKLNMPPRQTEKDFCWTTHAKNNYIDCREELLYDDQCNKDGRHTDNNIQTCYLPNELEKKLSALFAKEKSCQEETGVSVLHMAFGFLKWKDGTNNSESICSPLILIPVKLNKQRAKNGEEFWLSSEETKTKENKMLAEKLRLEFNISLPEYNDQGLEKYFEEVAAQTPKNMTNWEVKRRAVVGVFPSARLAMYEDLAPGKWDFAQNSLVSKLLGEGERSTSAKEHNVDAPEIEVQVPCLVSDADSSQFCTIIDVMAGKNLAVEGPPGTGKSQTIVNTIAAFLAKGKKVLFVAEKSAALEVVQSRLEACGLGKFLLPLHAKRADKEQVISSIRSRMQDSKCNKAEALNNTIKQYKETREKITKYIDVLRSKYADTDFTVYDILGKSIKYEHLIKNLPKAVKKLIIPGLEELSSTSIIDIIAKFKRIDEALSNISTSPSYWSSIEIANIDRFLADEILDTAAQVAKSFAEALKLRQKLCKFSLDDFINIQELESIIGLEEYLQKNIPSTAIQIAKKVDSVEDRVILEGFLNNLQSYNVEKKSIIEHLKIKADYLPFRELSNISQLLAKHNLSSLKNSELEYTSDTIREKIACLEHLSKLCQEGGLAELLPHITISDLLKMLQHLSAVPNRILKLREQKFDDESLHLLFKKQIDKAQNLKKSKEDLNKKFFLSSLPSTVEILKHASVLASASFFAFFSSDYRQAKLFYRQLAKEKFNKLSASFSLKELWEWCMEVTEFTKNEIVTNIIGIHFDGIETDFKPFEEVFTFFNTTNEVFKGNHYRALRDFCKYGDTETIQSLLAIDTNYEIDEAIKDTKIDAIEEILEALRQQADKYDQDVTWLKNNRIIFHKPETITKNLISELSSKIQILVQIQELLKSNINVKKLLGDIFNGEKTDDTNVQQIINLMLGLKDYESSLRGSLLSCLESNTIEELIKLIQNIISTDKEAQLKLKQLAEITNINLEKWLHNKSYLEIAEMMKLAAQDREGLIAYSRLVASKNELNSDSYKVIAETLISQKCDLCNTVEALIAYKMGQDVYKLHGGILISYNGDVLNGLRKSFKEADRESIKLFSKSLHTNLYITANPPKGNNSGVNGTLTELALIKHEIEKKQRYIPVRSLIQKSAKALLELKPCWMMSPLAVAQYISPRQVEFDLVIIDEASQITPEDAIGALLRAKQAMIVGDTNQLPPTNFFQKALEDDYVEEEDKVTQKSILALANLYFTKRTLLWHYRSKHSALIAFSNKHIYKDKLIVFPSPQEGSNPELGVYLKEVKDGLYNTGKNPAEAKYMANEIIKFMASKSNEDRSLGVVVLNQTQCNLLQDEVRTELGQNPHANEAKKYIEKWEKEEGKHFFIKNLENVQGDERDVIFIGTVYGSENKGGTVMQRFGPISSEYGKNRLNVLFSRAKEKIVTFSSMTAEDIKAIKSSNQEGAYMLKCWLEYSKSEGKFIESGINTNKEPGSDFEEHVIDQIKSIGCEAVPQVGVKGYFIDIGIKHPDWQYGFIMGVECDGATYHSSASARERDRLRQEVLEGLGWYIYRIWSTDWFEDSIRETEKLKEVINLRLYELQKSLS